MVARRYLHQGEGWISEDMPGIPAFRVGSHQALYWGGVLPWKTNMEPKHGDLEDVFPLK